MFQQGGARRAPYGTGHAFGTRSGVRMGPSRPRRGGFSMPYGAFAGSSQNVNWGAVLKGGPLTPEIQTHLQKVYLVLTMVIGAAAVGARMFHSVPLFASGGFLPVLLLLGLLWWFHSVPATDENSMKRFLILLGFGFAKGAMIGPLVHVAARLDPSLVTAALMGTAIVFVSFSCAAVFAKRRSMLWLYGICGSCMSFLFWGSLLNMFFRSTMLFDAQLYVGLAVFSLFIIVDTQMIIEKAAMGKTDALGDALGLFIDVVAIFVRILIILMKMNKKRRRNDN